MKGERECGALLHPTSLPGRYGIGDLGEAAYRFVRFLKDTNHRYWQILPLGHISFGNSPYNCISAFGGNPYLISPEKLVEEGLLSSSDLNSIPPFPCDRVDYGSALDYKMKLMHRSYENFRSEYDPKYPDDYTEFCENNSFWLDDYAMFVSLKDAHRGVEWMKWEKELVKRDAGTLMSVRERMSEEIMFWKYVQYQFFKQWDALREFCRSCDIRIIGDLPVYVAQDSAEVWAHRELFHLDEQGYPKVVSGVPPDYFSATGQRWGNPIYRWNVMSGNGFEWWVDRFRMNFKIADIVRLDHFRGFEAYWEIPASESTAVKGRWVKGPGKKLFDAVKGSLGDLDMIAEDLGVITPEVDRLREELGHPGMRVLQMAFGNDPKASEYRPHNHIENCVVYTAGHDHNTTVGWFNAEPGSQSTQSKQEIESERRYVLKYTGREDDGAIHWDFIRLALGSVAETALYPLQDILGLGTEARMNLPGTIKGNWEWRFTEDMLTREIREKLKELTIIYERVPPGVESAPDPLKEGF